MIPFAVLSGLFHISSKTTKEIRILDLAPNGFTFRLAQPPENLGTQTDHAYFSDSAGCSFTLHFYDFEAACYRELTFSDFSLETEPVSSSDFYTIYRIVTENPQFKQLSSHLTREYLRYIELKSEQDDAHVSQALTGYPAELEDQYPESFNAQKRRWFAGLNHSETLPETEPASFPVPPSFPEVTLLPALASCELALSIDRPEIYRRYLETPLPEFTADFWNRNHLSAHPLARKEVGCLYFGNQFCHLLFPNPLTLLGLLNKAVREHVRPVVVFSYVQEHRLAQCESLLGRLASWCAIQNRRLELVVNDWGMLSILRKNKNSCFDITLGVLLTKRRKDVRLPYRRGFSEQDFIETPIQAPFYREFLSSHFHVSRISYESCGYPVLIAPGNASLHFPFYQMNTSQFCPLCAACESEDRGSQHAVSQCPQYCRVRAFLYPEFLHMVGRYNSLFGYDEKALSDPGRLCSFLAQGGGRIVAELL